MHRGQGVNRLIPISAPTTITTIFLKSYTYRIRVVSLRPSALDDVSAIWSAHSSKEAVCSFPLAPVGLIGSFHGRSLSSTGARLRSLCLNKRGAV